MHINGQTILLSQHVDEKGHIRGLNARNATILGPAVLALGDGCELSGNTWLTPGGVESVIWEVDPGVRPFLDGAIWLFDCDWKDCKLIRIGVALAPGGVSAFVAGATVG